MLKHANYNCLNARRKFLFFRRPSNYQHYLCCTEAIVLFSSDEIFNRLLYENEYIYRDPSGFIVHDGSYCHVTAIIEKVVTEMFKFYNFYFIFNRLLRHFFFFYKKVCFRLKDPSCSLQAIVFIIACKSSPQFDFNW